MKNFIIVIWIVFAVFFIFPIGVNYISGEPQSEVVSIIEQEAEANDIRITSKEEHGNRSLFAFNTVDDFGVAVFSHFGDNYKYEEGMMSNGEKDIKVHLDTGWDVYRYEVTSDGARQVGFEAMSGVYKIYAIMAAVLAVTSIVCGLYSVRLKKKHEEQRKKGLRR